MLACTALVGCSSNDEPVVDNQKNEINGDAYITVKFSMAGNSATSRAFKDGNFQEVNSESAEATVSSATFYFLDANNQGCADSYTYTGTLDLWIESDGENVSIDKTATPIIVIKNPVTTPKYIVAVLNADPLASVSKRPSLAQIQAAVADYSAQGSGNFVMSNSVYVKDSKVITATEILETQIYDAIVEKQVGEAYHQYDKDGQEVDPVVIPVERVLAKVTAAIDEAAYKESNTTTQGESSAYTIEVKINGWGLANMTTTSYLVKKLSTSYNNFATNHQNATGTENETVWWNDVPNTRSYWAESPTNVTCTNTGSWDSFAKNSITTPLYCQENTTASPTEFVAAATLYLGNKPQTFVRWAGNIHTDTDFFNLIANSFQTYVIAEGTPDETTSNIDPTNTYFLNGDNTDSNGTDITPTIFGWCYNGKEFEDGTTVDDNDLEPYEGKIEVYEMTGYNLAKVTTDGNGNKTYTKVTAESVQQDIRNQVDKVTLWLDGKTYYYTNIIHNSNHDEIGETDLCAIVRNHLYKLNITGVAGMGTPAPAPDQIIDPETPAEDDESYLAAEIQTLSYKVVPQQNVTLR